MILLTTLLALTLQTAESEQLERIQQQIEEQERSAAEIRERTREMEEALDRLRGQLVSTAAALQEAEARATELERDLQDIDAREAVALEDRDAKSLELSQVLAALQNLERSRPPALVVSPDDAQGAARAAIMLSSLTPRLREIVEERKAEIIRLAALREEKSKARQDLQNTNTALSERRRLLQELLDEREGIYNQDRAALDEIERETRRLAQQASNLRELVNRLRELPVAEEALRSFERSRRDRDLPAKFSAAKGLLDSPVAGITAGQFGERDGAGIRRDALELITRPGAVVTTPFSGRVQWASQFGALGNVLIIDVGEGYTTILMGLSDFLVRKGQRISAGEPVGIMSPNQNAPRLKFQVRASGQPVDPNDWLASPP